MIRFVLHASRASAVLLAATLLSMTAGAQQQPQQQFQPQQQRPQQPAGKAQAAAKEGNPSTEGALRQRVEQLEEQLVDMQVMIGTLESLARGGGGGGNSGGGRGGAGSASSLEAASDAGRLDGLETQIRAIAAQLEQLQEQVRTMGGRSGQLGTSSSSSSLATNEPQTPIRPGRGPVDSGAQAADRGGSGGGGGFGTVTVSPDGGKKDDINRLLNEPDSTQAGGSQVAGLQQQNSAQGDPDADPKQLYMTAYGYLTQRDYGAAEAGFDDFLRQYPNHALAGNAVYWMGGSQFVRGQYRAAANAFLKGYKTYSKNEKAPESLLKLAMSLQRLGEKDAACSAFNELNTKYPNAPARLKTTAQAERQRAAC